IGSTYIQMPDYAKALQFLRLAQKGFAQYVSSHNDIPFNFHRINVYILNNLEECFLFTNKLDSAAYYIKAGIKYEDAYHVDELRPVFIADMGVLEGKKGNKSAGLKYFDQAKKAWLAANDLTNLGLVYFSYARLYEDFHQTDSAIFYAQKALSSGIEGNYLADEAKAAKLLYQLYDEQHNIPLAYKYYKTATQINDSIVNKDKIMELASMDFEQKQHQDELAAAKLAYQNTVRNYAFAAGLAVLALLALVFWRNAQHRKKANDLLHEQKEEIEATLEQLQATQTQLIQSEKMASLGELTAGIAHEIQNPLNFVNNFSEVSVELLGELKEEAVAGRTEDVIAIADDLSQNLEKIKHHGKRADAIVKGMLQHSRTSSGHKEPTNINALADEYLRLAYHGLRAKDKNFNAELITHFDEKLPKVNMVPQDIGRVLLNLFNNAFYATQQKAKIAGASYKPVVEVSTTRQDGFVIVSVRDNGNGVPENIKDKIMQPFFTTKPTGEGTGLGLSLSYDIVVKGHDGRIGVESKEGEGSEFIMQLPVN
ncbi:MAG: two-component sensor histidine kinase, partial [Bacteroidetes bacterium]|nr:two-component sensor histidine kinase [Bacteroidota bacterium]